MTVRQTVKVRFVENYRMVFAIVSGAPDARQSRRQSSQAAFSIVESAMSPKVLDKIRAALQSQPRPRQQAAPSR